jgi:hypothetical protein
MTLVERICLVGLAAVTSAVCLSSPARAQSAEAEVLFREGRTLIKRGKTAAGCDKLAASERLESSVGTLLNLGDCREKLGKAASAWAAFRKAEAMAKRTGGDDRRQAEAARRAAQLEPRLSNLVIEVPSRVQGLVVRRDGEVVDAAQWSTPLPVDPGSYAIVAEAPGHKPWRTTASVGAGSRRQVVVVPALERMPEPRPPEPVAAQPQPIAPPPMMPEPAPAVAVEPAPVTRQVVVVRPGLWSGLRKLSVGFALGGAGGLGTGVYFGWRAKDLQDRADRLCPLPVCTDAEALRLNDQARTYATRANVLYIAGGATLATALVLWLVGAPGETVVTPTAGSNHIGASMTGRF